MALPRSHACPWHTAPVGFSSALTMNGPILCFDAKGIHGLSSPLKGGNASSLSPRRDCNVVKMTNDRVWVPAIQRPWSSGLDLLPVPVYSSCRRYLCRTAHALERTMAEGHSKTSEIPGRLLTDYGCS